MSFKCYVLGYDLLLRSIAAFYVFMVPYTKVEESFNVQVPFIVLPQSNFHFLQSNRELCFLLLIEIDYWITHKFNAT